MVFSYMYKLYLYILKTLIKLVATCVIKYILGWKIMRDYDAYYQYRKDRHVIIYVHTSIYDIIIGYLVCIMYDIPIVGIGKKELLISLSESDSGRVTKN